MEKEIDVNGKKIIVKEITYLDSIEIAELREKEGLKAAINKQMKLATGLTEEEMTVLSMKEGTEIQLVVNELNSSGFQKPIEEKGN